MGAIIETFTDHNIRLDDGSLTKPDLGWLVAESPWLLATKRLIRTLFLQNVEQQRIPDVGCLEGGYTVEFARMGMTAIGLEVRHSNSTNCLYVKEHVDLPKLSFVEEDAWNLAKFGEFDVIFCCGLLYHLDRPVEFIKNMASLCRKALILNTHFATGNVNSNFALGELCDHEGVCGRWYHEYDPSDRNRLEDLKWTSWPNPDSFWIQREYSPDVLRDAGFSLVLEHFDFLAGRIADEMLSGYYATHIGACSSA